MTLCQWASHFKNNFTITIIIMSIVIHHHHPYLMLLHAIDLASRHRRSECRLLGVGLDRGGDLDGEDQMMVMVMVRMVMVRIRGW